MNIYGDSIGGLMQGQMAEQQFRQNALAQAYANMTGGLQNLQAQQHYADTMGLQRQQYAHSAALADQEMQLRRQQFDAARAEEAKKNALSQGYLDIYSKQIANQTGVDSPAQARLRQFQTELLFDAANRGELNDEAHAATLVPGLEKGMYSIAAARSSSIRPQLAQAYQIAENAAQTINKRAALMDQKAELELQSQTAKGDTLAQLQQHIASLDQQLKGYNTAFQWFQQDKPLMQSISFDAKTSRAVNPIGRPSWLNVPGPGGAPGQGRQFPPGTMPPGGGGGVMPAGPGAGLGLGGGYIGPGGGGTNLVAGRTNMPTGPGGQPMAGGGGARNAPPEVQQQYVNTANSYYNQYLNSGMPHEQARQMAVRATDAEFGF